ncbi:MAG: radical SAM protein [Nitrospirota bacterium]
MKFFLFKDAVLKWLETPSVYQIRKDELFELDCDSFKFLQDSASLNGIDAQLSPDISEFVDYCLKEEILSINKVSVKCPPLIKSSEPSLRYLELQITNRCNLKCKHCYANLPSPPKELSLNQIRKILKEFEEMQGLRVLISGGEPLLHRGFDEINEMLPEFSVRKVLFTNGLLLNKNILKKLNVQEIQISIDGLERAHDSLRGEGTFKSTIEAVNLSIDSGFEVSISTMVHPGNLQDFDDLQRLFRDMGIRDWSVDVPCVTGRLIENHEFQIEPVLAGRYLKYGFGDGLHAGDRGFACGLHLMAVMANGDVSKCTFYSDRAVGRIEETLMECWRRIKPIRLHELKCDCDYIESCRGGCRYRAELLGDPLGKDLYRCGLYDKITP